MLQLKYKTFNISTLTNCVINKLCICLIATLFFSCAQVLTPSGGAKDTTPPHALKYVPDSASVNFKLNKFSVMFNEYIQLRDLNSQLVISPPMKKMPDVTVKKKTVSVAFKEPLKENTTYTFNFGTAIHDVTEDNPAENFQYIFSTGSFIDSISFSGKAQYAFDKKTEKGILIMLYDDMEDSVPLKKLPNYFTKTKEDGSFKINNIKSGKYKLFALKDVNSNYLYDAPEESIGFSDTLIDLQKNNTATISLFTEPPKKLFLKKSYQENYGHLVFVFNKPVETIAISPLNVQFKKQWHIEEYNTMRDTLHLWLTDIGNQDSLILALTQKSDIIDTVEFKLIKKEAAFDPSKFNKTKKLTLDIKTTIATTIPYDYNKPIVLTTSHPIKNYDATKIILKKDSTILNNITLQPVSNNENNKSFHLISSKSDTFFLKEHSFYSLLAYPAAFTDIYDITNDTLTLKFKTQEEKYYGNFSFKTSLLDAGNYTIQMLNEKGNVLDERINFSNGKEEYKYLHPGKYKMKIIYDTNKNGKWDTGNYIEHKQPEKVIYYPEDITIRSNWDLELEWKASPQPSTKEGESNNKK